MDYAYRTHKEVPFGWLQSLQGVLSAKPKAERARPARDGRPTGGLA